MPSTLKIANKTIEFEQLKGSLSKLCKKGEISLLKRSNMVGVKLYLETV